MRLRDAGRVFDFGVLDGVTRTTMRVSAIGLGCFNTEFVAPVVGNEFVT